MARNINSLVVSLLLAVLLLPAVVCTARAAAIASSADEINHWHKSFPKVTVPATLARHESPLSTTEVDLYVQQLGDGSLVAASSQSFCNAAGILCGENLDVSKALGGHQNYINSEVLSLDSFQKVAEDPDRIDFFRESQLVKGESLRLPNLQPINQPSRKFLPHLLAQKFLLTHDTLRELLNALDIPNKSNLSIQVHRTMSRCLAPAMRGEAKKCVSSLQDMTDFFASTMGPDFIVLPAQDATVRQTAKLLDVSMPSTAATTAMTCHDNMYPFQVYYCHFISNTKIYQLKLQLQDGSVINKVTTCHMDTSQWPERHPAFAVLGTSPGESEACHYIIENDLLFVPASQMQ